MGLSRRSFQRGASVGTPAARPVGARGLLTDGTLDGLLAAVSEAA